jgi:hypothetical protein
MDSNACRAGEVERKVWPDNDFLLPGKLLKTRRSLSASPPRKTRGSGAVALLTLEQLGSEVAPVTLLPVRSRLVGLV